MAPYKSPVKRLDLSPLKGFRHVAEEEELGDERDGGEKSITIVKGISSHAQKTLSNTLHFHANMAIAADEYEPWGLFKYSEPITDCYLDMRGLFSISLTVIQVCVAMGLFLTRHVWLPS